MQKCSRATNFILLLLFTYLSIGLPDKAAAFESRNVAANRPYLLVPAPNYEPISNHVGTALTDGVTGVGSTWVNGQAVGWSWRSPTISIYFDREYAVDRAKVYITANKTVGILFPSQLFIYGGNGTGNYMFLASSSLKVEDESPAEANTVAFDISFDSTIVKEMLVIGYARGQYFFITEIEAWSAQIGLPIAPTFASKDEAFKDSIRRRRSAAETTHQDKPTGPKVYNRWFMPLPEDKPVHSIGNRCVIDRIDPWGNLQYQKTTAALTSMLGNSDYIALNIRNFTDDDLAVDVFAFGDFDVARYALAYVQSLDLTWVPDVVTPFETITLPPKSSIIVFVKITPRNVGRTEINLKIGCGAFDNALSTQYVAVRPNPSIPALIGNMWSYLDSPEHSAVKAALSCSPTFLTEHAIDMVDIPPGALQDSSNLRPTELLRQYMRSFRFSRYITLFMNINHTSWAFLSLPDDLAVRRVRAWWDWLNQIAKEENVQGEILIYPVDEPRLDDLALLFRMRRLIKEAGIAARFYGTIDKFILASIFPYDVVQLLDPTSTQKQLLHFSSVTSILSYSTKHNAKMLSVNDYYRSQAWRAFDLQLSGIGIWALWDSTGSNDPSNGWSPFGRNERDFATLYQGPDGCGWPSRRLLAWTRGIEEERLFRHCARLIGEGAVRQAVQAALASKNSVVMADAVARVVSQCSEQQR